ncbi:MAG: hypothetical protein K0Q79_2862 [Flavipsychrobacter sp.]|jgi:predicted metal-dependent HD superfamily phosphohydrolase|nr:hypothetical protein [Flavipsychrobacter sp.]
MEFEKVKKFILKKLKHELPKNLTYHSTEHIKDVYGSAKTLAKLENVEGEDLYLLLTAVLFHDSGFIREQKNHEQVSVDIAREYLPAYDYTPAQIDRICGMIMATKIPQTPLNRLEEIICDADLDYLGRDDFFKIGNGLYEELCMYGIINSETEWNKLQVRFLEKHKFFTKTARKLRKPKKDEYLAMVRAKVKE